MHSHIRLYATPWTGACKGALSTGLSRREYCSGYLFPSPGGLPDSEIKTESVVSPALAGNTLFPDSSCFGIILETLGRKLSKAGCQSTGCEHTRGQSCGLAPSGPLHMLPSSPKIPCGVPSLRKSVAERTPSPGSLPYPLPSAANLHFNLLLIGLFILLLACVTTHKANLRTSKSAPLGCQLMGQGLPYS